MPLRVTGYDALYDSSGEADDGPGVLLEALIGGFGALIVLIFVFGSALALVPLGMAICSVLTSFLLLWGLTTITEVSPIVQFLVALIGLGVSIDYALLVVVRWREELEKGKSNEDAVTAAMATAGRAVVFSGTTVAVGLFALIVLPLPFLRSVGYGGMLIPLVATTVAITLLPVVLATIGPKLDKRRIRRRDRSHAFWERWSKGVVKHRVVALFTALAILGALLVAATNLHLGNADPDTIAKAGPAKEALQELERLGHRQGRDRAGRDARAGGRRAPGHHRRGRGRGRARGRGAAGPSVAPPGRRARGRGAQRGRRVAGGARHRPGRARRRARVLARTPASAAAGR